jgi:hypothetical protein
MRLLNPRVKFKIVALAITWSIKAKEDNHILLSELLTMISYLIGKQSLSDLSDTSERFIPIKKYKSQSAKYDCISQYKENLRV